MYYAKLTNGQTGFCALLFGIIYLNICVCDVHNKFGSLIGVIYAIEMSFLVVLTSVS